TLPSAESLTPDPYRSAPSASSVFHPLALPQLQPPDFAANGLGQFRHKLNLARILVRRGSALDEFLQFPTQLFAPHMALRQYDKRLHNLRPQRVRLADDRGFDHGRVLDQHAFHLKGADPVRRAGNHIVRPPDKPEITVLIHPPTVAGNI